MFDYDTYGEPGSSITGSRYIRSYCPVCGEPIRITSGVITGEETCARCDHRPRGGLGYPIDDITGMQANMIRILEGD